VFYELGKNNMYTMLCHKQTYQEIEKLRSIIDPGGTIIQSQLRPFKTRLGMHVLWKH